MVEGVRGGQAACDAAHRVLHGIVSASAQKQKTLHPQTPLGCEFLEARLCTRIDQRLARQRRRDAHVQIWHELTYQREMRRPRLGEEAYGFMTSSKCVAAQLDRRCNGQHDHVHLVGGRASSAQVYPQPLCEAMLRGIAQQKARDACNQLITPKMNNNQLKKFVGPLASVDTRFAAPCSSITALIGDWCKHWIDPVHEEDGGNDDFGPRPQRGIELLKDELASLTLSRMALHLRATTSPAPSLYRNLW